MVVLERIARKKTF